MQVVYKNEDEGSSGRRTDPVNFIIYVRRIGRCIERKYVRGFGKRIIEI